MKEKKRRREVVGENPFFGLGGTLTSVGHGGHMKQTSDNVPPQEWIPSNEREDRRRNQH
jgi:hypothetical protein